MIDLSRFLVVVAIPCESIVVLVLVNIFLSQHQQFISGKKKIP